MRYNDGDAGFAWAADGVRWRRFLDLLLFPSPANLGITIAIVQRKVPGDPVHQADKVGRAGSGTGCKIALDLVTLS